MIYLDYNASTPIDPEVREAMLPFLAEVHANPSSAHDMGRQVRQAVDQAREQIASMIGAKPEEIIFTGSGTESNNHVFKGVADTLGTADRPDDRRRHLIISAVEHPAVVNPCRYLERKGFEVSVVGVDQHGTVDPEAIAHEVRPATMLISVMHANNEVGTIQPIAEIAEIAREGGIWMHTDAAQSCGKIETDVRKLGVDFLSIAGHKLYAPQGIGALYIRNGIDIEPLLHGAGHEGGRRAGTEAVPAIVALGKAAELATSQTRDAHIGPLRDRLWQRLRSALDGDVVLLGHPENRLPGTLAVGFKRRIGADVLAACPDLCATTGAACHTEQRKRSAVLAAMDVPEEVAFGSVRLSVGRFNTEQEIDAAAEMLIAALRDATVKERA